MLDLLMTQCWQIAILFGVVWAMMPLLRKASPRVRHALWLLVLIRFLVLPVAWLPGEGDTSTSDMKGARVVAWFTTPYPAMSWFGVDAAPTGSIAGAESDVIATTSSLPVGHGDRRPPADWRRALAWVLGFVYAFGVSVFAGRLVRQFVRVRRSVASSLPAPSALAGRVETLRRRAGVSGRVGVSALDGLASPVTVGLFRPRILVPVNFLAHLDPARVDHVLLHELIHVRRRDLAVHWLSTAIRIVYWFHPVAWLVAARIVRERELVADELAMKEGGASPMAYGETLIAVASFDSNGASPLPLPAMAGHGPSLAERIRGIKLAPRARGGRWSVAVAALALVASVTSTTSQEVEEVIEVRRDKPVSALDKWVDAKLKARGIALAKVPYRGVRLIAGPTSAVIVVEGKTLSIETPPKGGTKRRPFAAPPHRGLRVAAFVAEKGTGFEIRGRKITSARSFRSELRSDLPVSLTVGTKPTGGIVRLHHVAELVAAGWGAGVKRFTYHGTQMSLRELAELKRQLAPAVGPNPDVLLLVDGKAPWTRVVKVVSALSHLKISRVAFAVVSDKGEFSKLPMYLPTDVGLEEEIEEEIEEEEMVEEEEPVEEEEIEEEPVPPKKKKKAPKKPRKLHRLAGSGVDRRV